VSGEIKEQFESDNMTKKIAEFKKETDETYADYTDYKKDEKRIIIIVIVSLAEDSICTAITMSVPIFQVILPLS
jgi:hypothetical protein